MLKDAEEGTADLVTVSARLPREVFVRFSAQCDHEERSMAGQIRRLIQAFLDDRA